jgi:LacI family transcriptional regulator
MLKIGIQVDLAGGYGREALRGVMRYANTVGNWEFVMPPMYSLNTKKTVEPHTVDGVIGMLHSPRSYEPFRAAGIPVVNVARTLPAERLAKIGLPSVVPDDEAIGRLAYQCLRDLGFRQFGFCGHPTGDWSLARGRTFAAAAASDGFPCSMVAAADKVPIEWVVSLKKPCAILAGNDRYAWHAIDACREAGIRVPEDVAILGVDNDVLLAEMVRPTLSSITPDALAIGFVAAELLAELIQGKPTPATPVLLPPEGVVTRHSTDVLAMDDPDVVAAARFIRENAAKPISVDDVMQRVSTSRRNLERRFRRELGRSLLDEIRRLHMARATNLLRNTDLDIPAVARESGFTGAIRFSTVFRELMGMPPTQYRREQRVRRIDGRERRKNV